MGAASPLVMNMSCCQHRLLAKTQIQGWKGAAESEVGRPGDGLLPVKMKPWNYDRKLARSLVCCPLTTLLIPATPILQAPAKVAVSNQPSASPSCLRRVAERLANTEAEQVLPSKYSPGAASTVPRDCVLRALACVCCRALLTGLAAAGASTGAERRLCQINPQQVSIEASPCLRQHRPAVLVADG